MRKSGHLKYVDKYKRLCLFLFLFYFKENYLVDAKISAMYFGVYNTYIKYIYMNNTSIKEMVNVRIPS